MFIPQIDTPTVQSLFDNETLVLVDEEQNLWKFTMNEHDIIRINWFDDMELIDYIKKCASGK